MKENGDAPFPLHPILVALAIVIAEDGDLGEITPTHPRREEHKFYKPGAKFPFRISHLLPPPEQCWWVPLGK